MVGEQGDKLFYTVADVNAWSGLIDLCETTLATHILSTVRVVMSAGVAIVSRSVFLSLIIYQLE